MQFDKVIMNPPYMKELHLKILNEATKHSNSIINLSPMGWLQNPFSENKSTSTLKRWNKVATKIKDVEEVNQKEACEIFNAGFLCSLGIYELKRGEKGYLEKRDKEFELIRKICKKSKLHFSDVLKEKIPGPKVSVIIPTQVHKMKKDQSKNVFGASRKRRIFINNKNCEGKSFKEYRNSFSTGEKFKMKEKEESLLIEFNSVQEACNFINSFSLNFFRWLIIKSCPNQHVDYRFLPILDSYKKNWTEEEVEEFFELSEDEIQRINREVAEHFEDLGLCNLTK